MYDPTSSNEPAPPPYESSRELYDFKTAEALRRSTTVLRDTEFDQDGFEVWNEDAFNASARALKFAQDSENVSSGSRAGPTPGQSSTRYNNSASGLPPFTNYSSTSGNEKGRLVDEKGKDSYSYGGTRPLNIQKRPVGVRALPTPPVPRIETTSISNYPPEKLQPGPRSPTSSSVTESDDGAYQPPQASSSRQAPVVSPDLPSFSAIDAHPGTTLAQGADLGRAPTYVELPRSTPRPRHSLPSPQSPPNYPPMNQPMQQPQRSGRASLPPQATPTTTYTQPVPPPPPIPQARAEFNSRGPVVQFDPVKAAYKAPSPFGSLPRDPVTHAPNAAALYSSFVASHVAPKPPPSLPAHRRASTFGAQPPPSPSPSQYFPPPPTGFAPTQLPPGAGNPYNPSTRSLTPQQQHYAPVAAPYYPPQGGYYAQQPQPNQSYYSQTPQPPPPPPGAYSRPMSTYQPGWHTGPYSHS